MKKTFLLFACLAVFVLNMSGCQNSSVKENQDTTKTVNENKNSSAKRIENTNQIVIGYGANSYIAIIKDQKEINQLEKLFNEAEFIKSEASMQNPNTMVSFQGKSGSTVFYIDEKDVIKSGDDNNYMKSRQISFKELYSIFKEYASKEEQLGKGLWDWLKL